MTDILTDRSSSEQRKIKNVNEQCAGHPKLVDCTVMNKIYAYNANDSFFRMTLDEK